MNELETRPAGIEKWTRGGQSIFFEYDERGVVEVTIELLRDLLQQVGAKPEHEAV